MTWPPRGELSLGDLLTAAHRLGAQEPGRLLSFLDWPAAEGWPARQPTAAIPAPSDPSSEVANGSEEVAGEGPAEADEAAGPRRPLQVLSSAEPETMPAWWADATALPLTRPRRLDLVPDPPISPLRSRAVISDVTRRSRPGPDLDMVAVLRRISRAESLTPPPVARSARTGAGVEVLVDVSEGMEPYRADVRFFIRTIGSVAGRANSRVRTFLGDPGRGVDLDRVTGEFTPWTDPASGAVVVVLSDLGMGGPALSDERSTVAEWQAFAGRVQERGADIVVLTPFGAGRTPPVLRQAMEVIGWDELNRSGGVRHRGGGRRDR